MKKILTIAAVILTGTCVLFAAEQAPAKGMKDKGKQGENMKRPGGGMGLYSQVNLTEEQKAKIQEIFKNAGDQMKAVRNDTTLDEAQKRTRSREIMQTAQKQADEVLTPEQKTKIDQLRAQRQEEMKKQAREKMKEKPEGKPAAN